jgi:hypothetical protein
MNTSLLLLALALSGQPCYRLPQGQVVCPKAAPAAATSGSYVAADGRTVDWRTGPSGVEWSYRQAAAAPVPAPTPSPATPRVEAPKPELLRIAEKPAVEPNYGIDLGDLSSHTSQLGQLVTNDPQLGAKLEAAAPPELPSSQLPSASDSSLLRPQVQVEADLTVPAMIVGGAILLGVLIARRTNSP